MITVALATPLLLGSLWALIPAVFTVCIFVVRTALEDRMLQADHDDCADYVGRVHFSLIPGIW